MFNEGNSNQFPLFNYNRASKEHAGALHDDTKEEIGVLFKWELSSWTLSAHIYGEIFVGVDLSELNRDLSLWSFLYFFFFTFYLIFSLLRGFLFFCVRFIDCFSHYLSFQRNSKWKVEEVEKNIHQKEMKTHSAMKLSAFFSRRFCLFETWRSWLESLFKSNIDYLTREREAWYESSEKTAREKASDKVVN